MLQDAFYEKLIANYLWLRNFPKFAAVSYLSVALRGEVYRQTESYTFPKLKETVTMIRKNITFKSKIINTNSCLQDSGDLFQHLQ
jgi:hypothetical protein